jgi:Xaa-Pro aminopeptidase
MSGRGVDFLLVTNLKNVRYLSGFSGSAGAVLIGPGRAWFLTDFRYRLLADREVAGFERMEQHGGADRWLRELLQEAGAGTLGYESTVTAAFAAKLRGLTRGRRLRMTANLVEDRRRVKDADELRTMRRLIRIAAASLADFLDSLRPGTTEEEAALELMLTMRRRGSGPPPFDIIVASGPNSALPHHHPGRRRLRAGDTVVVDFGSSGDGYAVDMTRTVCLGTPRDEIANIHRLVYDAQAAAIAAIRDGAPAASVDRAARDIIAAAGRGDEFGHGTGHGVGLDVHEGPNLWSGGREILRPGMVVTVEPGVYLPGIGGVRIEDMVLVTGGGREVMTRALPSGGTIRSITS